MSQRPGHPDPGQIPEAGQAVTVLTAKARELIDGQYADRPHLRPVLDAVLAALPGLGPVTVQARTTLVSLVTPRRTFAVVQARTRNRVDLRLDSTPPGGRLLAARDIGAATVRIGLSAPGDLDEEALGWLRRAYEENTAPPPPRPGLGRRPRRRNAAGVPPHRVAAGVEAAENACSKLSSTDRSVRSRSAAVSGQRWWTAVHAGGFCGRRRFRTTDPPLVRRVLYR
jgi:hypothetical protein